MLPNGNHTGHQGTLDQLSTFLRAARRDAMHGVPAVSLFSGAGLSDLGYERAGFRFVVQAELDEDRATLCTANFPESSVVIGDLLTTHEKVIGAYEQSGAGRLQLLSITPPCQGMSSSNPGRGKKSNVNNRDERNRLLLDVIPIIQALRPRIVVVENVPQILNEVVIVENVERPIVDVFKERLGTLYVLFTSVVQMADYGIPQTRKRAVLVAIQRDESCLNVVKASNLLPIPRATTKEQWATVEEWFTFMGYPPLDARDAETAADNEDRLHFVPNYEDEPHRYRWIADIPPRSGRNAYQNKCQHCNAEDVLETLAYCSSCNQPMTNRPYVSDENGNFRLVKGFKSSYRRMYTDRPAPTVMTNSSHMGSDYKLHPWENRVLSIRECADLQTIPRYYDWDWAFETQHTYTIREVVGEALPPYFSYLHGQVLRALLENVVNPETLEPSITQQTQLEPELDL